MTRWAACWTRASTPRTRRTGRGVTGGRRRSPNGSTGTPATPGRSSPTRPRPDPPTGRRGPILLLGLAIGCLGAAFVSWKTGTWWGKDDYDSLLQYAAPGRQFPMPVKLDAKGLLFLEPLTAVLGYVVVAAWSRFPDLKADPGLKREHGRHWGNRPPDQ